MNDADFELIRRRIALEELARPLLEEIRRLERARRRLAELVWEAIPMVESMYSEHAWLAKARAAIESGEEPPPVERALKTVDTKG